MAVYDRRNLGFQMISSALSQIQQEAEANRQRQYLAALATLKDQPFARRMAIMDANPSAFRGVTIPDSARQPTDEEQYSALIAKQRTGIQEGFRPDRFQSDIIATTNLTDKVPNAEFTNTTAARSYLSPQEFALSQSVDAKTAPDANKVYDNTGPLGLNEIEVKKSTAKKNEADATFASGVKTENERADTKLKGAQTTAALRPPQPNDVPFETVIDDGRFGFPPGTPVRVPRTAIKSPMGAPRTVFDESGRSSVGGVGNSSLIPPTAVASSIQNKLSGYESLGESVKMVRDAVPAGKNGVGPILGRMTYAQMKLGGGAGLSPEEQKLAVLLQDLFATKGFDEGGKQLTGPEQEIFKGILPLVSDTVPVIMAKLSIAEQRIGQRRAATLNAMPPRQRGQVDPNFGKPNASSTSKPRSDQDWLSQIEKGFVTPP